MKEPVARFESQAAKKMLVVTGGAFATRVRNSVTIIFVFAVFFISTHNMAFAAGAPGGTFNNANCVACHEKRNNELVKAWQASAHAKPSNNKKTAAAGCVACHGNSHADAAANARKDASCRQCHGEEKAPVVHSYATSKHGIIVRLEQKEWDWLQPLRQANYRAPGCAYCHLHQGEHNVSNAVTPLIPSAKTKTQVNEKMRPVCQDCHSPRYVSELSANGERMLEIGRMKWREANAVIDQARKAMPKTDPKELDPLLVTMKKHLKNLKLGVAHQSPDYQWWHGHPALDSDLIQIKGAVGRLYRQQALKNKK